MYPDHAASIAGGEIMYKNLGGDSFLVTLNVYYSCSGVKPTSQIPLDVMFKTTKLTSFNVHLKSSKNVTNYDGCITSTSCDSGGAKYLLGFTRNTYTGIVSVKSYTYCEYTIAYSDSSRDRGITTGGSGQNFYVSTFFNKCQVNSSPVFDTFPQIIVCQDNCMALKNSATDPDGDSLVYSLTAPMQTAATEVVYAGTYSFDKPLFFDSFPSSISQWNPPSCAGFHLNRDNGTLYFEGKKTETSVIAVNIQKFRNISGKYVKIGEITRDIEIVESKCPPYHPPTLSGVNGTTRVTIYFKAGTRDSFYVYSDDPDKNDTVSLSWTTNITGDTITSQIKRQHPQLFFHWTPSNANASGIPYTVMVKAWDNSCHEQSVAETYYIYVDSAMTTSIGKYSVSDDELQIFPNPSKQDFTINYSLSQSANVLLEVYDMMGRKISTLVSSSQNQGLYKTKFSAGHMPDGIYILKGQI